MKSFTIPAAAAAILMSLFLFSCSSRPGKNLPRESIASQLSAFPESRAQDKYKSFCQDNLGPEHMIPDEEYAKNYLRTELSTYASDLQNGLYSAPEKRYYPVGDNGNFIRVDLSVVLDSLVSAEKLLSSFVESANGGQNMTGEEWKAKWAEIESVLREDFSGIPALEEDLSGIDSLVSSGNLILHHSREFNSFYHPHYRIIRKDVFEREILPLLQ